MHQYYLLLLAAILSVHANAPLAESDSFAWVLEQYQSKLTDNPDDNDPIVNHATGVIDGEEYLVLSTNTIKPDDNMPAILLFSKTSTSYKGIATITVDDSGGYYSYQIKNNAFYLIRSYAHHGGTDERYQFKRIHSKFRLIGADYQSNALGCYSGEDESTQCDTYEVLQGWSYNLLTSTGMCWRKNVPGSKIHEAMDRYNKWQQPKGGIRHTFKFKPHDLYLLDGFFQVDSGGSQTPPKTDEICRFDKNYRLIKYQEAIP